MAGAMTEQMPSEPAEQSDTIRYRPHHICHVRFFTMSIPPPSPSSQARLDTFGQLPAHPLQAPLTRHPAEQLDATLAPGTGSTPRCPVPSQSDKDQVLPASQPAPASSQQPYYYNSQSISDRVPRSPSPHLSPLSSVGRPSLASIWPCCLASPRHRPGCRQSSPPCHPLPCTGPPQPLSAANSPQSLRETAPPDCRCSFTATSGLCQTVSLQQP